MLCELYQCGSLIYFIWCSEIIFFLKYFAENKTCNFEYTENYSPTNPIIFHFISSVCTLELPWADYNLLKKRQRSILTFAECQILQCDNTHVLEKFTRSQSQEGRQGTEPILVCVAGRKSVRFSCTIHHLSLKLCSLPNTAIVLQGV